MISLVMNPECRFCSILSSICVHLSSGEGDDATSDELFASIARYVVATQNASINNIQKKFGCGFNRVQSIIQKLEELGVVGANVGSRARSVLMQEEDLEDILSSL